MRVTKSGHDPIRASSAQGNDDDLLVPLTVEASKKALGYPGTCWVTTFEVVNFRCSEHLSNSQVAPERCVFLGGPIQTIRNILACTRLQQELDDVLLAICARKE